MAGLGWRAMNEEAVGVQNPKLATPFLAYSPLHPLA